MQRALFGRRWNKNWRAFRRVCDGYVHCRELPLFNAFHPKLGAEIGLFFVRCTAKPWEGFKKILSLIKDDSVFDGARSGKQYSVETQLAVTLYRLGSSGEGATISKISSLFGIGDSGTTQVKYFFFLLRPHIVLRIFSVVYQQGFSCHHQIKKWVRVLAITIGTTEVD